MIRSDQNATTGTVFYGGCVDRLFQSWFSRFNHHSCTNFDV